MDEDKGIIITMIAALWDLWKEMFSALWEILPKVLSFMLWVVCAVFILPCVFIAGNLYPMWVEWGEDF